MSKMERPIPAGARFNGPLTKADMHRALEGAQDAEILPEHIEPAVNTAELSDEKDALPVITHGEVGGRSSDEHDPFSAELHKSRFDEGYFELARAVRDDGNEPNDLQSWQDAVALRREMGVTVAQFNRTRVVAGDTRTRGEQTKNNLAEKIKQLSVRFMDEVLPRVAAESQQLLFEKRKLSSPAEDEPSQPLPHLHMNDSVEVPTHDEARTALRANVEKMRKLMEESGMHSMEEGAALTEQDTMAEALADAGEVSMEPAFGEYERPFASTSAVKREPVLKDLGDRSMEPRLSEEAGWYDSATKSEAPKENRLAESVAFLAQRSQELNERAEKLGEVPKDFLHRQGDTYNKIPLKWKIALGLALGGAAAGFATVSPLVAGIAGLGLGAQRLAGFAGIYAKVEQHLLDTNEKKKVTGLASLSSYRKLAESPSGKRKIAAAVMAGAWTLGMSATVGEAVHLASESSWGDAVHEWLRNHWSAPAAPSPAVHTPVAPVLNQPPLVAHVPEHVVPNQFHYEPGATPNHPHIVGGPPPADLAPAALSPEVTPTPHPDSLPSAVHPLEVAPSVSPVETLATVHATPGHGYEYMLKRLSEQLQAQHVDTSHFDPTSDAYKLATASPQNIDTLVHQIASNPEHHFFRGPDGSVRIGLHADLSLNSDGAIEFNDGMGHMYVQAPSDAPLKPSVSHSAASAHADGTPSQAQVQQTAERLRAWHAANPGVSDIAPHVDAAGDVYGPPGAHTVDPPWTIDHPSAGVARAVESFTNPHGVEVNLSQPHVYAMTGGKIIVEGGGYDDRLHVAMGYVQQHGGSVQVEASAPVRVNGVLTRYLETVKKSGPFGFGGHIETSRLAGAPRVADVLSDSHERFATRFIKKLQ